MSFLTRLLRRLEKLSLYGGCAMLIVNICDILMGVATRYFLGGAPIWTEELARFSLVWMVLIGAAAAFLNGDQMSIDFIVNLLPKRGKAICAFLSVTVQSVVLVCLIWFGSKNVIGSWKMKTMALGVPKSLPLLAVPIGMAIFLCALLAKYVGSFREDGK